MLQKINSKAPFAISKVIECVHAHFKDGIDGFDTEIELFSDCVVTDDFKEGTNAFLEKRKAVFQGK
jgi:enoyl-CoA hydratase